MLLLENYLSYLASFRHPKTVRQKRVNLKSVEEFFRQYGETYRFDQRVVAEFFKFLREEKGLKLSTVKLIFLDLKLYLRFLQKEGVETFFDEEAYRFILSSPRLKNQAVKERAENEEVFTREELFEILKRLRERNVVYYYFAGILAFSGLRRGEALKLSIENFERVKPLRWKIRVKEAKFDKERTAYLLIPAEFADLDEYLLKVKSAYEKTGKDYLFVYTYGKKVYRLSEKSVEKFFREFSKEIGKKVNPHKFRKTFATLLAMQGVNPAVVKELLGHSDEKTTLRFYTFAKRFLEDEIEELKI